MPTTPSSAFKGYAKSSGKRRTNLSLNSRLVKLAGLYFKTTKHGSLSSFVENMMRREFRANAARIRKAGFQLPAELFTK